VAGINTKVSTLVRLADGGCRGRRIHEAWGDRARHTSRRGMDRVVRRLAMDELGGQESGANGRGDIVAEAHLHRRGCIGNLVARWMRAWRAMDEGVGNSNNFVTTLVALPDGDILAAGRLTTPSAAATHKMQVGGRMVAARAGHERTEPCDAGPARRDV